MFASNDEGFMVRDIVLPSQTIRELEKKMKQEFSHIELESA